MRKSGFWIVLVSFFFIAACGSGSVDVDNVEGWGKKTRIDPGIGNPSFPTVAIDSDGNAIVVWEESRRIWANHFSVGVGWDIASQIGTKSNEISDFTEIAVDGSGNAMAVWQQFDGKGNSSIWSNRYVLGFGWSVPIRIDNTTIFVRATRPQLAIDKDGNALVVWNQGGSPFSVWANRYTVESGWDGPIQIDDKSLLAGFPQVKMDGKGNALIIWRKSDGQNPYEEVSIWAKKYILGVGWDTSIMIYKDSGDPSPQLAVDQEGSALVVWAQPDGEILFNRYLAVSGWKTTKKIERVLFSGTDPSQNLLNNG